MRLRRRGSRTVRRAPRDQTKGGKAGQERSRARAARDHASRAGTPLAAGLAEVFAIGREMLAIPASMALGLAERLGLAILAALRFLRPIVLEALRQARRGIDVAARAITPARAIAAVGLAAAALLCVSQFLDYREVRAGVPAYAEVEQVAPPPQVDGSTRNAGSPHAYVLLLAGIAAGGLILLSMRGRWRLARLLFPLGLLAVAVAVFIDAPAGLDEGAAAVAFEGAEARLLGAFWVELFAGAVIAACGLMLTPALRPNRTSSSRPARGRRRIRLPRLGGSRVQGAGS